MSESLLMPATLDRSSGDMSPSRITATVEDDTPCRNLHNCMAYPAKSTSARKVELELVYHGKRIDASVMACRSPDESDRVVGSTKP
jgi:hypothetical protein